MSRALSNRACRDRTRKVSAGSGPRGVRRPASKPKAHRAEIILAGFRHTDIPTYKTDYVTYVLAYLATYLPACLPTYSNAKSKKIYLATYLHAYRYHTCTHTHAHIYI